MEVDGRARDVRKMKVEFERKGTAADMRICGGSGDDLTITIRIPSNTDLHARIPFGEVRVENVTGSKDVSLHAGELTVDVGDPEDYARVEASVLTGELDAAPFDEYTGGLFRSFRTRGSGSTPPACPRRRGRADAAIDPPDATILSVSRRRS